jgi:hypothetical protein
MTLQPEQVKIKWSAYQPGLKVHCLACGLVVKARTLDSAIDARMLHMARCSTIWESDAEMERRTR